MSVSEKVLWECLRKDKLGFRFKRQEPVGLYTLDFYCPEARLCVEVDGEQHAGRRTKDEARDDWLGQRGIYTLRVPSLDLFEETGLVAAKWIALIQGTCEKRAGRNAFPE